MVQNHMDANKNLAVAETHLPERKKIDEILDIKLADIFVKNIKKEIGDVIELVIAEVKTECDKKNATEIEQLKTLYETRILCITKICQDRIEKTNKDRDERLEEIKKSCNDRYLEAIASANSELRKGLLMDEMKVAKIEQCDEQSYTSTSSAGNSPSQLQYFSKASKNMKRRANERGNFAEDENDGRCQGVPISKTLKLPDGNILPNYVIEVPLRTSPEKDA